MLNNLKRVCNKKKKGVNMKYVGKSKCKKCSNVLESTYEIEENITGLIGAELQEIIFQDSESPYKFICKCKKCGTENTVILNQE